MKAGLLSRLSRLELQRTEAGHTVHRRVVRTPWDGSAEPPLDLPTDGRVQVVRLPQKAPSPEVWAAEVRQHWRPQEAR